MGTSKQGHEASREIAQKNDKEKEGSHLIRVAPHTSSLGRILVVGHEPTRLLARKDRFTVRNKRTQNSANQRYRILDLRIQFAV
jgi:hypothetical protein